MANPSLSGGFDSPFAEQIDFFRRKTNLSTEAWDDIWQAAHDRAFVVAGATKADLLADLRSAVDKAISQGTSLDTFRKDFRKIVADHGWQGWTGEGTPGGFAWRTRVIYETNLRTSYAAGRWAQLTDPAFQKLMPYWEYVHSDSVLNPRPEHLAWNHLTLLSTHEFWKTHYPPNGWGCRCRVVARRKPAANAITIPPSDWKRIDERTGAPVGIDKGWAYAPGASRGALADLVKQKAKALPPSIGQQFAAQAEKLLARPEFVRAKTVREAADFAVKANLADFADYTGIKPEVANAWNRSLYDHLAEFPALREAQKFIGTAQAQVARAREFAIARLTEKMRAAFPSLPPDFDFRSQAKSRVKLQKIPGNTYAISWDHPDVRGVGVNSKWGKDPEKFSASLQKDVEAKHHPEYCNTIRSVVDHELGHQLDSLLGLHVDGEVIAIYNEARIKGLKDEVSRYAATNIKEFVAECWAESCNSPEPRPIAARVAGILRQRYATKFS